MKIRDYYFTERLYLLRCLRQVLSFWPNAQHPYRVSFTSTWFIIFVLNKVVAVGRNCFYLTTISTHFIYGYMVSDIWLRTILIVRKETRCCHIGYSFRLAARVLLYAPSHRQDSTYHGLLLHQSWSTGWNEKHLHFFFFQSHTCSFSLSILSFSVKRSAA